MELRDQALATMKEEKATIEKEVHRLQTDLRGSQVLIQALQKVHSSRFPSFPGIKHSLVH